MRINAIGAYYEEILSGWTFGSQTDQLTVLGDLQIEASATPGFEYTFPDKTGTIALTNDINFLTGATFNSSNGILSLRMLTGNTITESLDGRYLASSGFTATNLGGGNLSSNVIPYVTASTTNSAFKVSFANTTGNASGNFGRLIDSTAHFTYNPSTNTLDNVTLGLNTIPYVTASTTNSAFKVTFANTTGTASGNFGRLIDNTANFTYNPSTNTMDSLNLGSGVKPYVIATGTNANYKVMFANTTGGASGNFESLIDDGSFTYNPSANRLAVQFILLQDITTDSSFSTSRILTRTSGGDVQAIAASGGGSVNFLRADGTWAPAGGGGGSGDVVTGMTFTTTTGVLELRTLSGTSITEDLDGRYAYLTGTSITNNYVAVGTGSGIEGLPGFWYDSSVQQVTIGISDTNFGTLELYGGSANLGGYLQIYNGATAQGTNQTWSIYSNNGNLLIEPTSTGGSLEFNTSAVTVSTGRLEVGVEGLASEGILELKGEAVGTVGGTIILNTADAHDTTVQDYKIRASADDFAIFQNAGTNLMTYDNGEQKWRLNTYNSGLKTGTANRYLAVDSSGYIIEEPVPSGQTLTLGTDNQIPVMNAGGTDFEYGQLAYDSASSNLLSTSSWGISTTSMYFGFSGVGARTTFNIVASSGDKTITVPNATGTLPLGTGTANQIAYWTGTNTLGSSTNIPSDVKPYITASGANANYKVIFANTASNTSGNFDLLLDSGAGEFTYNASSNTLTVPNHSISTSISGGITTGGNITTTNYLIGATAIQTMSSKTLNSPVITTQITTTSSTFSLFPTVATSVNAFGAATGFSLGGTPTTTVTANIFTNNTSSGNVKTLNLGTGSASNSTTNINLGSAAAGALGTTTIHSTTINFNETPATDASFSTSNLLTRDTSGNVDVVGASGGGTTNFLRADGTWAEPPAGGGGGSSPYTSSATNRIIPTGATATNTGDYSTIGGGQNNAITGGTHGFIGGGCGNTACGSCSFIGGGQSNIITASNPHSTIGGGHFNFICGIHSFVGGGFSNTIANNSNCGTISGGYGNLINTSTYGFIGGGGGNTMSTGTHNVIGGGTGNTINTTATCAVIGGGCANCVKACYGAIAGGRSNIVCDSWAFIGAGSGNRVDSFGFIGGGQLNNAYANYGTIVNGFLNTNCSGCAFIGNGQSNIINTSNFGFIGNGINHDLCASPYAAIVGGSCNFIITSGDYSFIGAGSGNTITNNYSFIGSGSANTIYEQYSFIGGGQGNSISGTTANSNFIGGGANNFIGGYNTIYGFIGGGNKNIVSKCYGFVGGGCINEATGGYSTVVGGVCNITDGDFGFVGGGQYNSVSGQCGVVAGGYVNVVSVSAGYSVIAGGRQNCTNAVCSGILGGINNNTTCANSFIIGSNITTSYNSTTHVESINIKNNILTDPSTLGTSATSGEVVYFGTSGPTYTIGNLYVFSSSGLWVSADADAASTSTGLLGIALGTSVTGGFLIRGFARFTGNANYTAMSTTGAPLYISTTAGNFTETAPSGTGDIVRIIGYVLSTTSDIMYFNPDNVWVEIA